MTPNQDALIRTLGMYPLMYATVWPDLSDSLARMYRDYAAKLPFLPKGWLDTVLSIHGKEGWILVPAPAKVNGQPVPLVAGNVNNAAVWQKFSDDIRSAVNKYAAGKAAEGRIEMDKANSEAYWADLMYRTAKVLATPVTVAQDAAKANWGKLLLWGIGILTVVIVYKRATGGGERIGLNDVRRYLGNKK